jgi:hypothetical protein
MQGGSLNILALTQSGDGNLISPDQQNNLGEIRVNQDGAANQTIISQLSDFNSVVPASATLTQLGNNNTSLLMQQ